MVPLIFLKAFVKPNITWIIPLHAELQFTVIKLPVDVFKLPLQ